MDQKLRAVVKGVYISDGICDVIQLIYIVIKYDICFEAEGCRSSADGALGDKRLCSWSLERERQLWGDFCLSPPAALGRKRSVMAGVSTHQCMAELRDSPRLTCADTPALSFR